jgi:deoxyribonuclease I
MLRPLYLAAGALSLTAVALAMTRCNGPTTQTPSGASAAAPTMQTPSGKNAISPTTAPTAPEDDRSATSGALVSDAPNRRMTSFARAKRALGEIHADQRRTFYCDCSFDDEHRIDHASCGYVPRSESKRAHRVEWEHIVPAEAFGRSFSEWRDGHSDCVDRSGKAFKGRNCARRTSEAFRLMEADMYNLVPVIGELNALRSNFSMGIIEGEAREFGACDVEIADGTVEPRPAIRGDVARTYQYMDAAYPGRGVISRKNRKLFEAWSEDDPVDAWECARARMIAAVQGNDNRIVSDACAARGL